MDAGLLSRIQFGVSLGFHFVYPATTLGLTFFILIFESLYFFKNDGVYKKISTVLIRLLALVFVMGVATGITLPFSFGTNFASFSELSQLFSLRSFDTTIFT